MTARFAEVAVSAPTARLQSFSYSVPAELSLEVGQAVWVPFGPRRLPGVVVALSDAPAVAEVREVAGLMTPQPVLFPHQVELARWISEYYRCPLFAAAALMLPPGLERRMETYLELAPRTPAAGAPLTPDQRSLLALLERRGRLHLSEVQRALGKARGAAVADQLARRGLIVKVLEPERPRARPKRVGYLRLAETGALSSGDLEGLRRRAPKQAMLFELLRAAPGPMAQAEASRLVGLGAVKGLIAKGLVVMEELEERRDPLAHRPIAATPPHRLTSAQEAAWGEIRSALESRGRRGGEVFLLHGVTGSGKTELYLRALAEVVARGERGIVLVPEIALTPQTIDRFSSRFPHRVAVLHSRLSAGELFDEWHRIREGAFDVVIGSRSAIFAPQPDLGLIVLDEEHEWTYKQQEQAPRYHAREVAMRLAQLTGAVVILGSATPSLESYRHAEQGRFRLLRLPERISTPGRQPGGLPRVEVVDLRAELKAGVRSLFSRALQRGVAEALGDGGQVILFLNRRGAAGFVQCRECGHVLRCRRCDVSLTYHSSGEELVCHQCNLRDGVPIRCPECLGSQIRFLGAGTQRVMAEAARLFPGARLLRWDRDVTGSRRAHEQVLDAFAAHEADILIGTQMIAKGLELPLVTLVGVINADVGLYLPDFRAGERVFQLLTQVAGRAGRGVHGGRVIVQTYSPQHYAVVAAAHHDYEGFYQRELAYRRELNNPPFSRLVRLLYTDPSDRACRREAERLAQRLEAEKIARGLEGIAVVGPAPAYFGRIRGRYRWQIILRGSEPERLLDAVALPQGWVLDVDPASLL